jgi:hypothetical protein
VVACYFNANFRIPPNLSSMLTHKALQILACRPAKPLGEGLGLPPGRDRVRRWLRAMDSNQD